jgi:hypothetical protein
MAAMAAYLRSFFSGGVDPGWPHGILLSITVLASFAVATGILLERPKYPEAEHRTATWLVLCGVAIEAICTIVLFVFDEGISSRQQSAIEIQRDKIIELDKRIAEDQQSLIWLQMPRHLGQVAKCREILRASPKGATVRILWRLDVSDGDSFAFFISTCFTDPEHPFPSKWDIAKEGVVKKLPDGAEKTGLTVISNKFGNWQSAPQTPGQFVTRALYEGVSLHMGVSPGYDSSLPDDVVIIAIGPKLP